MPQTIALSMRACNYIKLQWMLVPGMLLTCQSWDMSFKMCQTPNILPANMTAGRTRMWACDHVAPQRNGPCLITRMAALRGCLLCDAGTKILKEKQAVGGEGNGRREGGWHTEIWKYCQRTSKAHAQVQNLIAAGGTL